MKTVHDELLKAVRSLDHVAIPAPVIDGAAHLDQYDPAHQHRWAERTWEALYSLDRYAAEARVPTGGFNGSFFTFCNLSPRSLVSPRNVKLTESKNLRANARLMQMRYFPVDPVVDEDGKALMEAHIALQKIGNPAPRLYFLDDARGSSGKIHIGYVGKHLENLKTARSM